MEALAQMLPGQKSLPSRERELKLIAPRHLVFELESLPSRERELKRADESGV